MLLEKKATTLPIRNNLVETLFILHSFSPSLPAAVFLSDPHLSLPHQNLRKMEAESSEEPGRDLNELQNADWVGLQTTTESRAQTPLMHAALPPPRLGAGSR